MRLPCQVDRLQGFVLIWKASVCTPLLSGPVTGLRSHLESIGRYHPPSMFSPSHFPNQRFDWLPSFINVSGFQNATSGPADENVLAVSSTIANKRFKLEHNRNGNKLVISQVQILSKKKNKFILHTFLYCLYCMALYTHPHSGVFVLFNECYA